jgi:hypothetical protein
MCDMKKSIKIIVAICFSFVNLISQQDLSKSYMPLKCKGEIPKDFKLSYTDRFKNDLDRIPSSASYEEIKDLKEFYLKSGYSINSIFASGGVMFGDELTIYVNKIAQTIIEKNDIKGDLRFYVLKSSQVNAFCTPEGVIFVTVGLLSQIENESQLAFTLAHEIAHFTEKHSIESFVHTKEKQKSYQKGRSSYETIIKNLSEYSQENELEADRKGFLMMEKAGYDVKQSKVMISVLEYSDLPFDEVVFDTNYFNDEFYKIPRNKYQGEEEEVEGEEEDDEIEIQTHPEYEERKNKIDDLLLDENTILTGEKYLFEKNEFEETRTKARFENLKLNLLGQSYMRVMYEGYILEKKYPNNIFVKENIAKALYGIAKRKTADEEASYDGYYVGEYDKVVSFFVNNMDGLETSILAIKYIESVGSRELEQYQVDLASDMYHEYDFNYIKFQKDKKEKETTIKVEEKKEVVAYEDMSKIEKLEYKKSQKKKKVNNGDVHDYYEYAFVNELKKESFVSMLKEGKETEKDNDEDAATEGMSYKERKAYLKQQEKEKNKINKGVDKVLAIDPVYVYRHKKLERSLLESEKKEKKYIDVLEETSTKNGVDITFLSEHAIENISIEEYNRRAQLKECISELMDADDLKMIPTTSRLLDSLMEGYGSENLLFSGVFSYKDQSYHIGYDFYYFGAVAFVAPAALPMYFILQLRRNRTNLYYNAVYNIKDRKFIIENTKITTGKDKYYNNVSILNNLMIQLSK